MAQSIPNPAFIRFVRLLKNQIQILKKGDLLTGEPTQVMHLMSEHKGFFFIYSIILSLSFDLIIKSYHSIIHCLIFNLTFYP